MTPAEPARYVYVVMDTRTQPAEVVKIKLRRRDARDWVKMRDDLEMQRALRVRRARLVIY